MRKPIWKYVKLAIDTLPIMEPIYEFGAYQVAEAPENCDLRPLLSGKEYVGCDMQGNIQIGRKRVKKISLRSMRDAIIIKQMGNKMIAIK